MNRERAKELLPIIEAFANGEDIEYRWKEVPIWTLLTNQPEFNNVVEYRIKPKPRELWIPNIVGLTNEEYRKESALQDLTGWFKVREVTADE